MATLTDKAGIDAAERAGVALTHPHKVLYPGQGITKAKLVAYYDQVAARMLPHIADRPLSVIRCFEGQQHDCFFQRHRGTDFPEALKSLSITERSGVRRAYFYLDSPAGLVAGVQMDMLEFHTWGACRPDIEHPDRLVFDLDPGADVAFGAVAGAAHAVREHLQALGLKSFPLVTGGKGIHVVAPIRPGPDWPATLQFARAFARALARQAPDRFTASSLMSARTGRIFIDYLRNARGATAIAPFSTRARPGAPVAVPLTWQELGTVKDAAMMSLQQAAERAAGPDPWAGYADLDQTLSAQAMAAAKD